MCGGTHTHGCIRGMRRSGRRRRRQRRTQTLVSTSSRRGCSVANLRSLLNALLIELAYNFLERGPFRRGVVPTRADDGHQVTADELGGRKLGPHVFIWSNTQEGGGVIPSLQGKRRERANNEEKDTHSTRNDGRRYRPCTATVGLPC